jgi:hypothetical protein
MLINESDKLVHIKFTDFTLGLYSRFCNRLLVDTRQKDAEVISEILLKAASEPEFRNVLVKDPTKVLEQYNISPQAKLIIKKSITDLTQ